MHGVTAMCQHYTTVASEKKLEKKLLKEGWRCHANWQRQLRDQLRIVPPKMTAVRMYALRTPDGDTKVSVGAWVASPLKTSTV